MLIRCPVPETVYQAPASSAGELTSLRNAFTGARKKGFQQYGVANLIPGGTRDDEVGCICSCRLPLSQDAEDRQYIDR